MINSNLFHELEKIVDAAEETFLVFSQSIPSQDLGFVDPKAATLELELAGKNLSILQSPTLLASNRKGGTTGAGQPLLAAASPDNVFFRKGIIKSSSTVIELGCGVSGIVGLALAHRVSRYLATDQEYVSKFLKQNWDNNIVTQDISKHRVSKKKKRPQASDPGNTSNLRFLALDWETDSVHSLPVLVDGADKAEELVIDAVIACDCIYNESLIAPFVRTCADLCQLGNGARSDVLTYCIVAQQLRSPGVFEAWLDAFMDLFMVWRIPDALLSDGLKGGSGYVVHAGVLKLELE
ncbi:MAG: hypothetical protein Q9222_001803 [Ikaeria aurantiellina]